MGWRLRTYCENVIDFVQREADKTGVEYADYLDTDKYSTKVLWKITWFILGHRKKHCIMDIFKWRVENNVLFIQMYIKNPKYPCDIGYSVPFALK